MSDKVRNSGETLASLRLLYDISRELSKALDLRSVLQRVLSMSIRSLDCQSGSIIVVDDKGEPAGSAITQNGKVYEATTERLRATLESGLAGWVMRNRQAALVADTNKDERWIKRDYPQEEDLGPKSSISAPLIARGRLVGVMTLSHPVAGYFNDAHLELVQSIADQAAIAAQNARLFESSQRRAEVMAALAASAASISASLELDEVLQRILEQTSRALQADAVSLELVDPQTGELVFQAASGGARQDVIGLRVKMGQGISGWVAQEGQGVIVPEAKKDPRFHQKIDESTGYTTEAIAAAPIRSQGEVIGVLEALNPESPFTEDDLSVLTGIGNLAGTAIAHARLFEEVQTAHRRYLELFEDSLDPIFITNLEGKILEANRPALRMTAFEEENLLNVNIHQFHQVDWQTVGSNFAGLVEGETVSYETELTPKEGEAISIKVYVRKVSIEGENRLQWILRDITEEKDLDRLREDLVSMIYHDLRSPLANVVSGLGLIRSMVPEDPTIETVLGIAERSTGRVQRLVSSLLDTTRLEAGQRIGTIQPAALAGLVQEVVDVTLAQAEAREINVSIAIDEGERQVMIDPDMIKRVLINLVENALKFSPDGTEITVGAKQEEGWMHVWVEDQGRGILPDVQKTIFEKFSRGEGGTGKGRGLGLGLAFCKLAVEGHGGEIWVESEEEKGTRFTFTLPVAA